MFEIDWRTPHLWRKTSKEPHRARPALKGEIAADFVVVGAGFTGLSSALALAEAGLDVVVLEGDEVGAAASGRNNGLLVPHHSKASPGEIVHAFGKVRGDRYNRLVAGAALAGFALIERHGIQCDAVRQGWIQPAHAPRALARVRQFHDEWRALGARVEWLDEATVTRRVGSHYLGGWQAADGGHVNPYALAQGMAACVIRAGARLFEGSKVIAMARDGARWRLSTPGGTVTARQVLLATNALTGRFWPGLAQALIPLQVFQAATGPVPEHLRQEILPGNPAVSDTRRDIRAFHYDADFRIVTGGTHTSWHRAAPRGLARTSRMLARAFPQLGPAPRVTEYWEGVFAVVPDRRPRLMRLAPGVVFAGIYSGRGVALALALGQQIGAWLAGHLGDDQMPLPVTDLRRVFAHPLAVQLARRIHPLHRLQDRWS